MANVPFDPRVVDALVLVVASIASTLEEAQRAAAHEMCDVMLSNPGFRASVGAADEASSEAMRRIVDGMFAGWPASPSEPPASD